jgi:pimeloyl-ACP methyl ester carboxylesterase
MRIESLLSARLFLAPQLAGDHVYFVSDLSGRLSLYRMQAREGGSVPEPLLPPHVALQNPHLMNGHLFVVYPRLGQILLMLDSDGNERYQPMRIPLAGGFPEAAFGGHLNGYRVHALKPDTERGLIYFGCEAHAENMHVAFRGDVAAGTLEKLAENKWGAYADGVSADHSLVTIGEGYTAGDNVFRLWQAGQPLRVLFGTPLEERVEGQAYPPNAINQMYFTTGNRGLLFIAALFDDCYSLAYARLDDLSSPAEPQPVDIIGQAHTGVGELDRLDHMTGDRYHVGYNIDGVSWLYEGTFDEEALTLHLERVVTGTGPIAGGVLESVRYDEATGQTALAYSTATSPTQIYSVPASGEPVRYTRERVLGLPDDWLSPGEDASFTAFDGLRVSARLYRPAAALGFEGPRPLVYYVHGGPQGQERPDFAWFSMPLIQYLALNGFAVFVPNVRGSTGYGLRYMKHVDHDWGGQDRLDHVHAMTQVLPNVAGVDVQRAAVVGRSYGGYMTLTLASRHPELWRAAVDMFGPYNLFSFMDRLPETWKPYFHIAVGHPDKDRDFLLERSPSTHIDHVACPLLIIQGKNDPRVIEPESRDVVERLRSLGKQVEYLVFENEGHDVLKFENKVRCYNAITKFFREHLRP